jgi:hypothetical protein
MTSDRLTESAGVELGGDDHRIHVERPDAGTRGKRSASSKPNGSRQEATTYVGPEYRAGDEAT